MHERIQIISVSILYSIYTVSIYLVNHTSLYCYTIYNPLLFVILIHKS